MWHAGFLIRQCELNKPRADPQGSLFLDFFKMDRDGRRKGIVKIDLKDLP